MAKGLNLKQRRFVAEYLKDLNATQAAIRAGYSPKTAHVQGCQLLKHPKVAEAVGSVGQKVDAEAVITAEWVLKGIKAIGDKAGAKDADKLKAFELGGKYKKLFTEKQEVTGADGGPVVVEIVKEAE